MTAGILGGGVVRATAAYATGLRHLVDDIVVGRVQPRRLSQGEEAA